MVISALWRCFSMARITLLSNLSPRILRIFVKPVSTDLRRVGVISHFLPVNSTFMGAGDAHVFSIFSYGATRDLDALRLQNAGNLLIGQRPVRIFFFD